MDRDGTVLYDSEADPATMENHADRQEIRQAMLASQGTAQRESSTLSRRTYYAARRLSDGTVIRLASAQSTVVVLLASMIQPLLIILVLAMILAAVLASRLARGIIRPILDLNLEEPEECQGYDELAPLITQIRRQNDTIRRQMDAMRQRQREFAALTENMSEGVVLLNTKGRILSYNSGALRLLGAASPAEQANVLTLDRSDAFRTVVERCLDGSGPRAAWSGGSGASSCWPTRCSTRPRWRARCWCWWTSPPRSRGNGCGGSLPPTSPTS
ncbi:MAG: PAS domain-containing protein [Lawsonibacter sp.]